MGSGRVYITPALIWKLLVVYGCWGKQSHLCGGSGVVVGMVGVVATNKLSMP